MQTKADIRYYFSFNMDVPLDYMFLPGREPVMETKLDEKPTQERKEQNTGVKEEEVRVVFWKHKA